MLESTSIGVTVLERKLPTEAWRTSSLTSQDDILRIPEIGIEISLAEIYDGLIFPAEESDTPA
jgi:hypothetical protein